MSAYLIAHLNVTDPGWIADYVADVPAIIRSHGGDYLAVSQQPIQFEGGGAAPDQIAIFTFPSMDALNAFMASDAYRPYKEARAAGTVSTVIGFEG